MANIYINSQKEVGSLKKAADITAGIIDKVRKVVKAGITTKELDDYAAGLMRSNGVKPAFLGYRGYPASICVSIDSEVVHGIPNSKRLLAEGQIVSIDIGIIKDGFCGDSAITVPVGDVSPAKNKLLETAKKSLEYAISFCREGMRLGDVSNAIQLTAESAGYNVVRDFVGHGIGRSMHEDPQIPNFGARGTGVRLQKGMVFALEPMINIGTHEVRVLNDGWTVVTKDGLPSAHFEKMVCVGDDGPILLSEISY